MSISREVYSKIVINGRSYSIKLINNPTIDDVLETEARIYATERAAGEVDETRSVPRTMRDYLVRLGVER